MEALRDKVEDTPLVDPKETKKTKSLEEVALISIYPDYLDRHVMIKTELIEELRNALVEFLKRITMCLHGHKAMSQARSSCRHT